MATRTLAKVTYNGELRIVQDNSKAEQFGVYLRAYSPFDDKFHTTQLARYNQYGNAIEHIARYVLKGGKV